MKNQVTAGGEDDNPKMCHWLITMPINPIGFQ